MSNSYFKFKKFTVNQDKTAMKVGSDSVLLGSWIYVTGKERNILDIGAGTGLLSLMMAQRAPTSTITAVEIDGTACQQAHENIMESLWANRMILVNNDIRLLIQDIKYDLIISNPPYFENSLKSEDIKRNLARHTDNLSFCELLECVHKLLLHTGIFALIVPKEREKDILELAEKKDLFPVRKLNIKPKALKPANRVILELSFLHTVAEEHTLIIREDNSTYTDNYKDITSDFYL